MIFGYIVSFIFWTNWPLIYKQMDGRKRRDARDNKDITICNIEEHYFTVKSNIVTDTVRFPFYTGSLMQTNSVSWGSSLLQRQERCLNTCFVLDICMQGILSIRKLFNLYFVRNMPVSDDLLVSTGTVLALDLLKSRFYSSSTSTQYKND